MSCFSGDLRSPGLALPLTPPWAVTLRPGAELAQPRDSQPPVARCKHVNRNKRPLLPSPRGGEVACGIVLSTYTGT